jgi:hypothetical protein
MPKTPKIPEFMKNCGKWPESAKIFTKMFQNG